MDYKLCFFFYEEAVATHWLDGDLLDGITGVFCLLAHLLFLEPR